MQIDLIQSDDAFSALEREWGELYRSSEPKNPFLSYAWTLACRRIAAGGLFIVTIRSEGRLIGIAPLLVERRHGFRILRFIADSRSDYLGFLCAAHADGAEVELVRALARLPGWDLLVLQKLASPFTQLHEIDPPAGFKTYKTFWTTSAYSACDGDWDFLHEVGPSWLREMRKRRRKFKTRGGRVECFAGPDAIPHLDVVSRIEASSWKGREGIARLQPGEGQTLLRRAFDSMGPEMRLWIAFVADAPAAFQIGFVTPERLLLYQGSFDEQFSSTRAGSVLAYVAIEHAWSEGVREYDFLAGDEPYKIERTTSLRPIHYAAFYRTTFRGALAYWLLLASRWKLRRMPVFRRLYDLARAKTAALRTR